MQRDSEMKASRESEATSMPGVEAKVSELVGKLVWLNIGFEYWGGGRY